MTESEFHWRGRNREGQTVRGIRQAATRDDVHAFLEQQRIRPLHIWKPWRLVWTRPQAQPTKLQITQFTRQLATLIHAGVPLFQALQVLMQTAATPTLHKLAATLQNDLAQGLNFHQALRKQPAFDALYCNLVAAAELAGMLDTVLHQLAHHREKSHELQRQIRAALFYPSIVLVVALVVLSLLLAFVVPSFEQIFSSFGAQLPWLTQTVIDVSHHWFGLAVWGLLIGGLVQLGVRQLIRKQPTLQHRLDVLWLRLPLIGPFVRQACVARWTRTLATLFSAGIALTQAVEHITPITGNWAYAQATHDIHQHILQGRALSQALGMHAELFPAMLIQMCAIGEESGSLDQMLSKVADHAEQEVQASVTYLSKLVEPAIMVVLGVLVGGLVMALYLPIFEMGQVV